MLLPPLLDKLNFIRRFYDLASEPFIETKRKIDQHEAPFDVFDMEDGEPPFLAEWQDADESVNILGKSCLCLLQNAFVNCLKGFYDHYAPLDETVTWETVRSIRSWFEKYRRLFLGRYGIDWAASGTDLDFIQQINFARNDIQHRGTFYDLEHRQNEEYFNRFPASIFANELERELYPATGEAAQPYRITVSRDNLFAAIQAIEDFCTYLDGQWWHTQGLA